MAPSDDLLVSSLAADYGISASRVDRLYVGSLDALHYLAHTAAGRLFLTVDDLSRRAQLAAGPDVAFGLLTAALQAAYHLRHSCGLDFVVAPIATTGGAVTVRLSREFSLTTFPFVESTGPVQAPDERAKRRMVLSQLARLHACALGSGLVRPDPLVVPRRQELAAALDDLRNPWPTGPYGELARALLNRRRESVSNMLIRYDLLVGVVSACDGKDWVLTHGEPHRANILWGPSDDMLLVDWDTVALAPRERDLWMILDPESVDDLDAYTTPRSALPVDPTTMELYRLAWGLAEIAEYLGRFRRPHIGSPADRAAWDDLAQYLPSSR